MFTEMFETKTPSDCCMGRSLLCIFLSICLVMCFGISDAADLRDGLINYWPLDGDAIDSIGKHDGEVIGGPKWVNARIGKGWVDCCGGNRFFKGIIDEVMIFDRALSEDEIMKLATQGLAVDAVNKLTTTWGKIKRSR